MSADPNPTNDLAFAWWQRSKRAEHQKLMGHIEVLRWRAERQLNATNEAVERSMAASLARRLLDDKDSWRRGDEPAHVHADALEELLPLIAGNDEVDAMFNLELSRRHDGVSLADVVDASTLASMTQSSPQRPSANEPEPASARDTNASKAAALSILYRVRADRLRHERLMGKHRGGYLQVLAGIILITLLIAGFAIWRGTTAETSSGLGMPMGAELVTVVALGGLGGALASTFKIREIAELNTFRVAITYAFMQPIVGAAFGFVSFLLLLSGIVSITELSQPWAFAAVVAFAAGSSEPFALGILERVIGSVQRETAT